MENLLPAKSKTKTYAFALLGVALLGVARETRAQSDQSEVRVADSQPIEFTDTSAGKTRVAATPEVVLQLKYESGELNRIYLAQYRKEKVSSVPPVLAREDLCADLCHAGLGGEACGPACSAMMPVGLQAALQNASQSLNHSDTDMLYGEPRVSVCPTLCENGLGDPLCNCVSLAQDAGSQHVVLWGAVCSIFCLTDNYVLAGCPTCEELPAQTKATAALSSRLLTTTEGWIAWCLVQCHQGRGGAACNCDRPPF